MPPSRSPGLLSGLAGCARQGSARLRCEAARPENHPAPKLEMPQRRSKAERFRFLPYWTPGKWALASCSLPPFFAHAPTGKQESILTRAAGWPSGQGSTPTFNSRATVRSQVRGFCFEFWINSFCEGCASIVVRRTPCSRAGVAADIPLGTAAFLGPEQATGLREEPPLEDRARHRADFHPRGPCAGACASPAGRENASPSILEQCWCAMQPSPSC